MSSTQLLETADDAVAEIEGGSPVLIGGFGLAGVPFDLVDALIRQGAKDLTIVANNAGNGEVGLAALLRSRRVCKVICSFPRQVDSYVFDDLYRAGKIELEVVPQGNLAERMRAAGAGIGAFFTPTGYGTLLAEGKETRVIEGRPHVLEYPIRGDYALISAHRADRLGNLDYRKTARNFGPVMATAATTTIAQVADVVATGTLDPQAVVTPSIYVDRLVQVEPRHYTVHGARTMSTSTGRSTATPTASLQHLDGSPLSIDELAALIAGVIPAGSFVNLGIGQPTRRSPTTWGPNSASCCTPRTACSVWDRLRARARSTPT